MNTPWLLALSFALLSTTTHAQTLNSTTLQLVRARMNDSSTRSWEMGTHAQTLIEIDYPSVSVFSSNYLSPTPPSAASLKPVLSIAERAVDSMGSSDQLVVDGSAADPASLGVAVLLGNWTNAPGANWAVAAQTQLTTLLARTPRTPEGAISHRKDEVQLWSDFIYMVPPFLAYYGAVTSNTSLIAESVRQISLYRTAMLDTNTNLWRHVLLGSFSDPGRWSTGNGWAAAGMLRVLATIKHSPFAGQFKKEQSNLSNWIAEIHNGMAENLPASGIFNNYVIDDGMNAGVTNFPDAAGTAVFASTVYQHITLASPHNYGDIVTAAEKARNALYANNGADHFDRNGWLRPVVNPDTFSQEGTQSPEGQCFVLQLENNWRNWVKEGSNGAVGGMVTSRGAIAASSHRASATPSSSMLGFCRYRSC